MANIADDEIMEGMKVPQPRLPDVPYSVVGLPSKDQQMPQNRGLGHIEKYAPDNSVLEQAKEHESILGQMKNEDLLTRIRQKAVKDYQDKLAADQAKEVETQDKINKGYKKGVVEGLTATPSIQEKAKQLYNERNALIGQIQLMQEQGLPESATIPYKQRLLEIESKLGL